MSIRSMRIKAGLSQNKLAMASGVAREQINRYENRRNIPDVQSLMRIRDALGCTLDDLVADDDEEDRDA